jgi:hypothetical protein
LTTFCVRCGTRVPARAGGAARPCFPLLSRSLPGHDTSDGIGGPYRPTRHVVPGEAKDFEVLTRGEGDVLAILDEPRLLPVVLGTVALDEGARPGDAEVVGVTVAKDGNLRLDRSDAVLDE